MSASNGQPLHMELPMMGGQVEADKIHVFTLKQGWKVDRCRGKAY
jgi:hypothetical protein